MAERRMVTVGDYTHEPGDTAPVKELCYKQQPGGFERCDRKFGHPPTIIADGQTIAGHSWELADELRRLTTLVNDLGGADHV